MKNLNVGITDETDARLEKILRAKGFKNRLDAVEWLIELGVKEIKGGA